METRNEQLEVLENVHEMLTEVLKLAANEPSVGLYFVQQHVHKAVPRLLRVKDRISETTGDADLAMADAKDCSSSIKTMKECGPPVIERMIKTLQSASSQIPTPRQSRGSFSQLLPRTVRPSKGPLRSSSFLGDWRSNASTNKGRESFRRERPMAETGSKRGPALPVPDSKRSEPSRNRDTDLNQNEATNSAGCDSSDTVISNETPGSQNEASAGMLSLLGSAISKSRDGVKLITKDVENQLVGDGKLKKWITGQSLLGLHKKPESAPQNADTQAHSGNESGMSNEDLVKMKNDFEKFQVERAAKLEAWLSESDEAAHAPASS